MHKETNRFKTYTQLEKTYRKILVRWPRQHGQSRTEFRRTTPAAADTAVFLRMGKSEPLILLRQDT